MRPDFLDRYSRLNSPIHRLPAGLKLMAAMALVVTTVVMPGRAAAFFALAGGFLGLVAAVSRIPVRFLVRRVLLMEPVVLTVGLLAVLQPGGWRVLAVLVAKCTLCLLAMILLANTTPFSQLLRVLQAAHVPGLLITTLMLMYRYLFVLVDETDRMKRARASRTFTASRVRIWQNLASVIGQLFVRASERAERIYWAMCARGWR